MEVKKPEEVVSHVLKSKGAYADLAGLQQKWENCLL
jgi:hypothetical protein